MILIVHSSIVCSCNNKALHITLYIPGTLIIVKNLPLKYYSYVFNNLNVDTNVCDIICSSLTQSSYAASFNYMSDRLRAIKRYILYGLLS